MALGTLTGSLTFQAGALNTRERIMVHSQCSFENNLTCLNVLLPTCISLAMRNR